MIRNYKKIAKLKMEDLTFEVYSEVDPELGRIWYGECPKLGLLNNENTAHEAFRIIWRLARALIEAAQDMVKADRSQADHR